MWDFSDDEWVAFIASAAVTVAGGFLYYRSLDSITFIGRSLLRRFVLGIVPPVALVPAWFFICNWSDRRVAGHPDYIALFLLAGAAALFISATIFDLLGISVREDVLERDNPAALIVVCSMMLAVGIVYAGANVGGGPTIWTTLLPAGAGILALAALRLLLELVGGEVFDAITIDRDMSAAFRLAGLMVGCAIMLGRAAGGEWISWPQTWDDFLHFGSPTIPLTILAGIIHRAMRPSAIRPRPNLIWLGLVPAAAFALLGFGWVALRLDGLHPWKW